jgi:hypothetical protein
MHVLSIMSLHKHVPNELATAADVPSDCCYTQREKKRILTELTDECCN